MAVKKDVKGKMGRQVSNELVLWRVDEGRQILEVKERIKLAWVSDDKRMHVDGLCGENCEHTEGKRTKRYQLMNNMGWELGKNEKDTDSVETCNVKIYSKTEYFTLLSL